MCGALCAPAPPSATKSPTAASTVPARENVRRVVREAAGSPTRFGASGEPSFYCGLPLSCRGLMPVFLVQIWHGQRSGRPSRQPSVVSRQFQHVGCAIARPQRATGRRSKCVSCSSPMRPWMPTPAILAVGSCPVGYKARIGGGHRIGCLSGLFVFQVLIDRRDEWDAPAKPKGDTWNNISPERPIGVEGRGFEQ